MAGCLTMLAVGCIQATDLAYYRLHLHLQINREYKIVWCKYATCLSYRTLSQCMAVEVADVLLFSASFNLHGLWLNTPCLVLSIASLHTSIFRSVWCYTAFSQRGYFKDLFDIPGIIGSRAACLCCVALVVAPSSQTASNRLMSVWKGRR